MNYRLKKEAVQFFDEKLATEIKPLYDWKDHNNVDKNALEEVRDAYVTYGFQHSESHTSLSGWSNKEGTHFHFTIHFPSVKHNEHDKFSKGRITRELMDKMQYIIDNHYKNFVNLDNENK